jgi:dihydrodipicolinate synthase/N-acetylneuraminate lyase
MQKAVHPKDMVMVTRFGHPMFSFEMLYRAPPFVTELVNFTPELVISLHKAARNRDYEKVKELIYKLAVYDRFVSTCGQRWAIPSVLSSSTGGRYPFLSERHSRGDELSRVARR